MKKKRVALTDKTLRQDFLDKIKVRPRIVSPRFGKMIEVQLVQKRKKMTHKIRCQNWCTLQHLILLSPAGFTNNDEEKCLDNTKFSFAPR